MKEISSFIFNSNFFCQIYDHIRFTDIIAIYTALIKLKVTLLIQRSICLFIFSCLRSLKASTNCTNILNMTCQSRKYWIYLKKCVMGRRFGICKFDQFSLFICIPWILIHLLRINPTQKCLWRVYLVYI